MSRLTSVLVACWGILLAGCGTPDTSATQASLIGIWEMVEDREHPRHEPPTETIEFSRGGGFVMRMNGKVEMEGSFRVEKAQIILTHGTRQTQMGAPMTIKRLTADSLLLTSDAGKVTEFLRK